MMAFRRMRFGIAAAALMTTFAASSARAQLNQTTAADRETARSLMQEARDLRDKGDLKGALQRFKSADDIMHVPTTGLEVARTQVSLGLLVEARDTIAAIRKAPSSADDPTPFKEARVKADELDAQIEGRIPTMTITVTGAGEGETPTVLVDGVALAPAVASLPRKVDPGHHVVKARGASGQAKQEFDIAEGDKKDVQLALSAETPATPEENAAPPEAETSGVLHTPGPFTWVGIAVGGVGLAVGGVTGILELSKASSLKGECHNKQCSGPAASDLSSAQTLATVSTVSFVVAGAGAAVAVISLIIGHKDSSSAKGSPSVEPDANPPPPDSNGSDIPPQSSHLEVVPYIGPGSAGVFGTF